MDSFQAVSTAGASRLELQLWNLSTAGACRSSPVIPEWNRTQAHQESRILMVKGLIQLVWSSKQLRSQFSAERPTP
ncbi:hypothetical protein WG66_010913 [Moniliophthora roreri]|nr:hypothetical protein WG66_010913 [Moniliophthora roreri]